MYVAVKGGEKAISAAHELLRREGRGDPSVPDLGIDQLIGQLRLAVDRVMAEGSLYDRDLAALAIKQAQGDLLEAVFLVRAYRTTLPRFGSSLAVDTSAMRVLRRISATWKDLPGGQILGATFDYTHRLLDRTLSRAEAGAAGSSPLPVEPDTDSPLGGPLPRALDALVAEGLLERPEPSEGDACRDITRHPLELPADAPADRGVRLQALARADEGFLLGMAYSTQRGFGAVHPFTGELRRGWVEVSFFSEELGFDVVIGEIELTECETVSRYTGTARPPCFTRGVRAGFRQQRAQGAVHVHHGSRPPRQGTGRTRRRPGAESRIRAPARRQRGRLGFCPAHQAAALRGLSGRSFPYPRLARQAAERQGYLDATDRRLRGRAA